MTDLDDPASLPHEKPASSKRRGRLILLFLAAALAGWPFFAPSRGPSGGPATAQGGRSDRAEAAVPVTVARAHKDRVQVFLEALGTVTPVASVTVRPQVSGQLTEVGFQEGQMVQQGDFLAQIDPRPFENQLRQAQGQLTKDQAQLEEAKINLVRYEDLVKRGAASKQQLEAQQSLVRQFEGASLADQAQIDAANLDLSYARVLAPLSGRVGLRAVDPGNYVQTGDAGGLVTLTQIQPISVLFTLPEDQLPPILKGLNAGETFEVAVFDRAQSAQLARGKVVALDSKIDTSTGTIKLRALFDNDDGGLFPNQFVNVRLLLKVLDEALVVPSSAVQSGAAGQFVYALAPDQRIQIRAVKTGPSEGEATAVLEGLQEGDKVVLDGTDKLAEGVKVEVVKTVGP